MKVTRVKEIRPDRQAFGDSIDPPLDPDWSDLKKLQWNAAVVECDHNLPEGTIKVHYFPTNYNVVVKTPGRVSSSAVHSWEDAWSLINGISKGLWLAEDVRRSS